MKLSVIVPVYNVEKFLPRCLDSLLRQGLESDEYEVICVNDGSPDNCASILAEYEAKHPDIFKVVTQENQGLGGARNTGTSIAKGEYVTYLDSDDYIIDNAYSYFMKEFCQDRPDVLCYDYGSIYTDGIHLHDATAKPDGVVTFDGDGGDAYNRLPLPFVWSKFYKRSFLYKHGIQSKIVICQDELFNFDVFRYHPHTRIVSSKVCRYEQGNENSIQRLNSKEKVLKQLDELYGNMNEMNSYLHGDDTAIAPAARRNINNFLNVYHKKILLVPLSWKEWYRCCERLKAYPPYEPVAESDTRRARLLGQIKKEAGRFYLVYGMLYLFRNVVFLRCLRPLMMRKRRTNG